MELQLERALAQPLEADGFDDGDLSPVRFHLIASAVADFSQNVVDYISANPDISFVGIRALANCLPDTHIHTLSLHSTILLGLPILGIL